MTEQEVAVIAARRRNMKVSWNGLDAIRRVLEASLSVKEYPLTLQAETVVTLTYRLLVRIRQRLAQPRKEYTLSLSSEEVETIRPILLYLIACPLVGVYEQSVASSVCSQLSISK